MRGIGLESSLQPSVSLSVSVSSENGRLKMRVENVWRIRRSPVVHAYLPLVSEAFQNPKFPRNVLRSFRFIAQALHGELEFMNREDNVLSIF